LLEERIGDSVDAAQFDRFQLAKLDVFENGQGVDLQDLRNLLGGVKRSNHGIHFLILFFI